MGKGEVEAEEEVVPGRAPRRQHLCRRRVLPVPGHSSSLPLPWLCAFIYSRQPVPAAVGHQAVGLAGRLMRSRAIHKPFLSVLGWPNKKKMLNESERKGCFFYRRNISDGIRQ